MEGEMKLKPGQVNILTADFATPGMLTLDIKELDTLKVNFKVEGQKDLDQNAANQVVKERLASKKPHEIYKGYADVPMNTDNAWIETTVVNIHDEDGKLFDGVSILAGPKARFVTWQTLSTDLPLWGPHAYFLRLVEKHVKDNYSVTTDTTPTSELRPT
ncbi:ADP-ribose pyrophosphatase, mitochondrial-like [Aplysia californica]|uniref:ADP-ribose pyrophosphatase, mitochondrial-like n=1 Tax=Aplysia californica TaxID=6500 RepID=A0ABM0JRT3_APLCA|nr:ADP-ribose pyrophosphatase, mitochondrial-like [Aplysia californica]